MNPLVSPTFACKEKKKGSSAGNADLLIITGLRANKCGSVDSVGFVPH